MRFQRYYFALVPFMVLLASRMLLWAPYYFRSRFSTVAPRRSFARTDRAPSLRGYDISAVWADLIRHRQAQRLLLVACWSLVGIVMGSTVLYSLAFQQIYLNPHPAVAASTWINENIPPGTAIVSDNHWDEFVPRTVRLSGLAVPGLRGRQRGENGGTGRPPGQRRICRVLQPASFRECCQRSGPVPADP